MLEKSIRKKVMAENKRDGHAFWTACKGQTISKANYAFLNSSIKQTKLTILSKEEAQDSEFRSLFGRI